MIGLVSLSLQACAGHYKPIDPTPAPIDVPDAALVAPCDVSEADPATNGTLINELTHTRKQRDDCATRMDGVRKWRTDATARAAK